MEVIGKVVKIEGKNIVLQIPRSPACAGCRLCHQFEESSYLEAENQIQARVGDLVKVVLPNKTFVKASFLAYGLPLFFFFSGYFLGQFFSSFLRIKGEGLAILFSFLSLFLSFLILRLLYPSGSQRVSLFLPQAREIVNSDSSLKVSCDYSRGLNKALD